LTKDISKLIEAVNRVGIQNISLLARMTGMPTETIRYTVKKRFPNMGLNIRTPLNHNALGLERYFVTMKLTKSALESQATIRKALSTNAFLTYWCEDAIERRRLAFFSIPVALADEFRSFMDTLVKENVLIDYTCEPLEWSRHPELKSKYYDFSSGEWSVDWEEVRKAKEAPPTIDDHGEPSATPEVDVIDTLLIKELELDSWRNIADIARKLKLNERTVRWHYRKHVVDVAHSSYVNWIPVTPSEFGRAAGLIHEFRDISNDKLAKLRLVFNNFPFAWFEGGRKDGYYQVHSALPAEEYMESIRYLNAALGGLVDNWKTWTVDLSTILWYTIPYENFDGKKGWFFDKQAAVEAAVPQKMKIK
jgi:hypothetical protein